MLRTIDAGHKHACGVGVGVGEDGRVYCWGRNTAGQLGDGTLVNRLDPDTLAGDVLLTAVAAHAPGHSCALTGDGAAYCWGVNTFGQLGDGTTTLRTAPVPVSGDLRFRQLSVGFAHTCGVTTDDRVYCWGAGGTGQLGTGELTDASVPQRIANRT